MLEDCFNGAASHLSGNLSSHERVAPEGKQTGSGFKVSMTERSRKHPADLQLANGGWCVVSFCWPCRPQPLAGLQGRLRAAAGSALCCRLC